MILNNLFRIFCTVMLVFILVPNLYAIEIGDPVYAPATHTNPAWQELATYAGPTEVDQYGVFWSVDGGAWGRDDLYVGDKVQFKFNVHKENVGTHYADFLKAWVDWDRDGQFDVVDQIAYGYQQVKPTNYATGSWANSVLTDVTYYSGFIGIVDDFVGDILLRARVTCSHSLVARDGGSWWEQWTDTYKEKYEDIFSATGYYYQGEVEEWVITVHASPVPEPSTMLLLTTGLVGLVGWRKYKR